MKKTLQEQVQEKLNKLDRMEKRLKDWFIELNTGRNCYEVFEIHNKINEVLER